MSFSSLKTISKLRFIYLQIRATLDFYEVLLPIVALATGITFITYVTYVTVAPVNLTRVCIAQHPSCFI